MKHRPAIELNPDFERAFDLMEHTRKHLFVTGRAGTGKSTLLSYFREQTDKNVVVLAPTGVAAVNVKGQTIHSFFGFKPDITVAKVRKLRPEGKGDLYKKLDAIVIDEISMVRADLMDCIDAFLRRHGPDASEPFGGVQMILIGDLYQLPPVVGSDEREIFADHYQSPYFFSAHVFSRVDLFGNGRVTLEYVELKKIYRQKDRTFIDILNAVRSNAVTDTHIREVNKRYRSEDARTAKDGVIHLTTTNSVAAEMNERELSKLSGEVYTYESQIEGEFDAKYLPTDMSLRLKIGAQVMLLNNDSDGRWINGTIGRIVRVVVDNETKEDVIHVRLDNDELVEVRPHQWELYRFEFNPKASQIESKAIGACTQYPMKLAWAVTIHKSQGKTFDRVVLDLGRGTFAPGQLYVALSRCTTLEGIILKAPIERRHIWTDRTVVRFMTALERGDAYSEGMML